MIYSHFKSVNHLFLIVKYQGDTCAGVVSIVFEIYNEKVDQSTFMSGFIRECHLHRFVPFSTHMLL